MKNLLRYSLFFFVIAILISCKKADYNDDSKRNQNWAYWIDEHTGKASWIPIAKETTVEDGVYYLFYNEGQLYEKGKLKNRKYIDTLYRYNQAGQVIKYKIRTNDSSYYFYPNDGYYEEKYQDGSVFQKGTISNNKFNNYWVGFYPNGQIEFEQDFIHKSGTISYYYENGKKKSLGNYKNGLSHGETKIWFNNENIDEISFWKNGVQDSIFITYYKDGVMESKSFFEEGKLNGLKTLWYENGNIKIKSNYKEDNLDGSYKQWNNSGQIEVDGNYINGILEADAFIYHENSKIKSKGGTINEIPHGTWSIFDTNGKLVKMRYFKNGNLIKEEKF